MRFRDFLRVAVLLFGGAATALAVVSIAGASRNDDRALLYVALGWWVVAAGIGLWLGRPPPPPPAPSPRPPPPPSGPRRGGPRACPSSSRARSCSTGSGRWPCCRSRPAGSASSSRRCRRAAPAYGPRWRSPGGGHRAAG